MSKRSAITSIIPLPPSISREVAVATLHDHHAMIENNPLVIRYETTDPPSNASRDESRLALWYEITDRINYLPGGAVKGEVSYKACMYNLPTGLQTHVFAPAGVDIRSKWTVGGNMPGEPREVQELGLNAPKEGLYIKEEVDLRCSIFMSNFVKKNMKKSHREVAEKIIARARFIEGSAPQSTASQPKAHFVSRPMNRNSSPVSESGAAPYSDQRSYPSPIATWQHSRSVSSPQTPSCTCPGSHHQLICPFLTPAQRSQPVTPIQQRQQEPFYAMPPDSQSSYARQLTPAPSPMGQPSELHGSAARNTCMCTGGLHESGCPFYPNLRLVTSIPASSIAPTPSASWPQGFAQSAGPTGDQRNTATHRSGERGELPMATSSTGATSSDDRQMVPAPLKAKYYYG